MNFTTFQMKFTNGYWLIALILRYFFTLECCLRTWLVRTLIYSSKNHELCIPFGQNFNLKLLIALFFCELLLCRCILNLLLLNSYSILAADFCKHFLTKAYSQSLERPYRETTIGGFCYLFFGEGTPAGGGGGGCGVDALILLAVQTKLHFTCMQPWICEQLNMTLSFHTNREKCQQIQVKVQKAILLVGIMIFVYTN